MKNRPAPQLMATDAQNFFGLSAWSVDRPCPPKDCPESVSITAKANIAIPTSRFARGLMPTMLSHHLRGGEMGWALRHRIIKF